jgi:hypothetical protein
MIEFIRRAASSLESLTPERLEAGSGANLGTIVIGLVVLGVVAAIVIKLIRDKRKGSGCSCGCGACREVKTE